MYQKIYVPVDNSEYSNRAVQVAVGLGTQFRSTLVGSHVYAAKMHDYRFKQMEFTLPEEYLQEEEIERQRKIHDSLITMGLELISDCYLDTMGRECEQQGLPFERKMMDGKHHTEILKDVQSSDYNLVVLGALGVGKSRDSVIGSVCERVTRYTEKDTWVIKHVPKDDEAERDVILVGIDGSPQSFGALVTAVELAKRCGKNLELISVYDPYLHYAVFNSIVDVLNEKAAKVFRFEEQNQLHEEIIDTGLAQIYQSHLDVAAKMVEELGGTEDGRTVRKTLLDGKAYQKILNHVRDIKPWLLVVGRTGVHRGEGETGLGSNSENLLRLVNCDILLTTSLEYPALDVKADQSVLWTAEAEARMVRVPEQVRGIARTAILRLAIEQGHSVVTNSVIDDAMERFMPKRAAEATERLAAKLVIAEAERTNIYMCSKCGVTARSNKPVKCTVCGAAEFNVLTPEMVSQVIGDEGGESEELSYDGRKLSWSQDARRKLNSLEDKYQRRRAKARIEKAARMKKLSTITVEFAKAVIEDEVGQVLFETESEEEGRAKLALHAYSVEQDKKLLGVDEKGNEFTSVFAWNDDAISRILQVPAGFMRDRAQERAENLALEKQEESITLEILESSLDMSREMMIELLKAEGILSESDVAEAKPVEKGKCPFSAFFSGDKLEDVRAVTKEAAERLITKFDENGLNEVANGNGHGENGKTVSHVYKGAVDMVLNEAGLMRDMHDKRSRLVNRSKRPLE